MINVNQITSQLAMMPDQALQKYAMLNKSDPYTVSLALAEANRRKAMRAGAAPMPGPQPKVVDQDIAEMAAPQQLPENIGIGQLPAQNIQGMADGGIVGYADTGLVQSELPGGLGILSQGAFGTQPGSLELQKRIAAIQANPRMSPTDKQNLIAQVKQEFFKPTVQPTTVQPTTPVTPVTQQTPTASVTTPTTTLLPTTTSPTTTPPTGIQAVAPNQLPPSLLGNAGQGIKATPAAGLPSVEDYIKRYEMALPKKEELEKEEDYLAKRSAPFAEYKTKAFDYINKQKDQLKTDKEQDFYMALIEGGLAAAGEGGPNALQNISKGLAKGAGSYAAGLKDLRKAAQENAKMELEVSRAEAADKKGDMDAYERHMDKAKDRNADVDKLKAQGLSSLLGHKVSGEYQLASTNAQVAGHLATADLSGRYSLMAHGMPTGVERMVNQMPGATFEDKLKAYSSVMGADARGDAALLQKYAGKEGEMALKLLEAGTPQEKAFAQMVRSKLQGALLTPMSTPTGAIRP